MRRAVFFIIAVCIPALLAPLNARDINLDSIYISRECPAYSRLITKKMGMYEYADSVVIDRDVVSARWIDGFSILYVKELPGVNIIHTYNRSNLKKREIGRFRGSVIATRLSSHGKYLFVKRLLVSDKNIPRGDTLFVNIVSGRKRSIPSKSPFIDFSVTPSGNAVLHENNRGIVEYFPESGISRVIAEKMRYSNIITGQNPTVAYLSPNRKKLLCVNGSGGMYRGKVLSGGKPVYVNGITSATEVRWINNSTIVFRKGSPGYFSVCLFNTESRKTHVLMSNSLNTGLHFSPYPKMLTFQKDQLIYFFNVRKGTMYRTALEGDDVLFSHDGSRFISLFKKRLILSNYNTVLRNEQMLKKKAGEIKTVYGELLKKKKCLLNEFSYIYLRRKYQLYTSVTARQ